MNKLLFALFTAISCLCFAPSSYGYEEAGFDLFDSLVPEHTTLDHVFLGHQKAAKFFGIYMCPDNPVDDWEAQTNIISYQGSDNCSETTYHIGWYADGYIVTQLNGDKEGYQTVVWNDEVVGLSYPSTKECGVAINKYSWGFVSTQQNRQYVEGIRNLKR